VTGLSHFFLPGPPPLFSASPPPSLFRTLFFSDGCLDFCVCPARFSDRPPTFRGPPSPRHTYLPTRFRLLRLTASDRSRNLKMMKSASSFLVGITPSSLADEWSWRPTHTLYRWCASVPIPLLAFPLVGRTAGAPASKIFKSTHK